MKMPIRILSLIAVILSVLWIYYNGTLESWLAFVVALSAIGPPLGYWTLG